MIPTIMWAAFVGGLLVLEGVGLVVRGPDWPTISDMFRTATRPLYGRWLLFALWLWAGWHFLIRGWRFLLQGPGAGDPARSSSHGGAAATHMLTQVVLPLLLLYLMIVAVLIAGLRARVARRVGSGAGHVAAVSGYRKAGLFVRYVLVTTIGGYLLFAGAVGLYRLLVGNSASGLFWSAARYGAILSFGIALPVFVVASAAEAYLTFKKSGASPR